MSDDNELTIIIRSLVDDPSVQESLKEIINLGKESAGAVRNAFNDAYIYQTEWASKSLLVTREDVKNFQIAQQQKAQYYKEFTAGVAAELKAATVSSIEADKERLWSFQQMQKQSLDAAALAEKEMVSAHSAALIENTARDKAYFDELIAQQKEAILINKQMNADIGELHAAALIENTARDKAYFDGLIAQQKEAILIRKQMYLDSLTPPPVNNTGGGNSAFSFLSDSSLGRLAQFYALYKAIQLVTSSISGVEKFIRDSITLSDKIRDTDSAIKAYSTSWREAARSQEYFTNAMDVTRLTSLELAKIYVDILPKGLSALGKQSESILRSVTVDIASIGNLHPDVKIEDYSKQFAALIGGGRLVGGSTLSRALGLTPDELKAMKATNVDWRDDIIKLLHSVALEGAKVGKSLSSIWEQTKFSMMAAFAEGFLSARGNAITGMEAIRKILIDPAFLQNLRDIGEVFARSISGVALILGDAIGEVKIGLSIIKSLFSLTMEIIFSALSRFTSLQSTLTSHMPDFLAISTTGRTHADWEASKKDIDGYIKYWKNSFNNASNDIVTNAVKVYNNTVKNIQALLAPSFPSPNPNIRPDATDNPEAQAALEAAAAAKQAKKDEALQKHQEALQKHQEALDRAAQLAKDRYDKEISYLDNTTEKIKNQIIAINDLVKANDDSIKSFKNNADVREQYDLLTVSLDKNWEVLQKNLNSLEFLPKDTQEASDKIHTLVIAYEDMYDAANKLAQSSVLTGSINALFTKQAGWNFSSLNDDAVKDAYSSYRQGSSIVESANKDLAIQQAKNYAKALKVEIKNEKIFEDAASLFIEGILGGSKTFSRAAAEEFKKLIGDGTKDIIDQLMAASNGIRQNPDGTFSNSSGALIGKIGSNPDGSQVVIPTKNLAEASLLNQSSNKTLQTALGFAQIGIGAYSQAKTNSSGSITSGIIGGAISGFSITGGVAGLVSGASIYGAVAGAIIGGISAELGKAAAQADYKYAAFQFNNGAVSGYSNNNITATAFKKMLGDVQNVYDTVYNGVAKIVIDFGKLLPTINLVGTGLGQIQPNPSGYFLEHYNDWLSNTLPNALIGGFKDSLQSIAVGVGFTINRFTAMWTEFSKLDPATQIQLWSDSLHAAQDIQSVMAWLHGTTVAATGSSRRQPSNPSTPYAGTWEQYQAQQQLPAITNPDYFTITQADRDNMLVIGKEVKGLTGAAQVAAAKTLSGLMTAYMNNSITFMKALVDLSKSIADTVTNRLKDLTAAGMLLPDPNSTTGGTIPDYKKQAEFYKTASDQDLANLKNAKTPDAINAIWAQYQSDIEKTASLQSQLGPANTESARQWLMAAYIKGQELFNAAITAAGKAVDAANAALVAELQPYINAFTGALDGLTNAITGSTPYVAGHWSGNRANRVWIPPVGDPNNPTGDPGGGLIGPIDRTVHQFDTLNGILGDFSTAIINATATLNNNSTGNIVSSIPNYRSQVSYIRQRAA